MEDHYTQVFGGLKGVDLWLNDAPAYGMNGTYGGLMYVKHMVNVVEQHDGSSPLFLYMPFQVRGRVTDWVTGPTRRMIIAHPSLSEHTRAFGSPRRVAQQDQAGAPRVGEDKAALPVDGHLFG